MKLAHASSLADSDALRTFSSIFISLCMLFAMMVVILNARPAVERYFATMSTEIVLLMARSTR